MAALRALVFRPLVKGNEALGTRDIGTRLASISLPKPTYLLVSAKTRSSGIINFQSPRFWDFQFYGACLFWFKSWRPEIKSLWMRIECLCGTNLHRFYIWKPCLEPKHACAVKPEVLKSWTLEVDFSALCLDRWALGARLNRFLLYKYGK